MTQEPAKLNISNLYIYSDAIGSGSGIYTFPNSNWGTNDMYDYMESKLGWHWNTEEDGGPSTTHEYIVARNDWQIINLDFQYATDPGRYYIPRGRENWLTSKEILTGYTYVIEEEVESSEGYDLTSIDSGTVRIDSLDDLNSLLDRLTDWLDASTVPAEVTRQQRRKAKREAMNLRDK